MKIRKARKEDARKISMLIRNTINKINAEDYPKKQLEHELSCYTVQKIKGYLKTDWVFCAIDKEKLIGVLIFSYKNKALNSLFLKSDYIGKGFGKELMIFIEKQAKKRKIQEITLYPTKFAKPFYKRLGYEVKKRFKGTENGGFLVTEMRKKLK